MRCMRTTGAIYASNRPRNEAGINRNHDATTGTGTNGQSLLTTGQQQTSRIRNTFNRRQAFHPSTSESHEKWTPYKRARRNSPCWTTLNDLRACPLSTLCHLRACPLSTLCHLIPCPLSTLCHLIPCPLSTLCHLIPCPLGTLREPIP
jgi:hypothetical protein